MTRDQGVVLASGKVHLGDPMLRSGPRCLCGDRAEVVMIGFALIGVLSALSQEIPASSLPFHLNRDSHKWIRNVGFFDSIAYVIALGAKLQSRGDLVSYIHREWPRAEMDICNTPPLHEKGYTRKSMTSCG